MEPAPGGRGGQEAEGGGDRVGGAEAVRAGEPGQQGHAHRAAGVLTTPPEADDDDLALALTLREAVYRLASAARTRAPYAEEDRRVLNAAAGHPPVSVLLGEHGVVRDGGLRAALSSVARAAVELLGGPQTALIRECEAAPCTRLYVDASHRRTRRWCDMRGCGNRAKARVRES
ncbi:CGNR zinc finger domain-containing protein [Nonomuraea terrae]|uniref:CGNR zinc finger domain-containing protein n=1 Tax=Nonomuraea terrae TaxID=2530383 RepID=UPI001FE7DBA0|nr:CGNR zinc finger domain-containing protein [Nonomuraea terrae]